MYIHIHVCIQYSLNDNNITELMVQNVESLKLSLVYDNCLHKEVLVHVQYR